MKNLEQKQVIPGGEIKVVVLWNGISMWKPVADISVDKLRSPWIGDLFISQ